MLETSAPRTCPLGSKPTERTAANSSEESDDPQVPLRLISAILASATGGKSSLLTASSLAWRLLLRVPGLVAFLNFVERVGGLLAIFPITSPAPSTSERNSRPLARPT